MIRDNDVNVPFSIDRCTPPPPVRSPPANQDMNIITASLNKTPTPALNDTNDHPDVTPTSQLDAGSPHVNTIAQILSQSDHLDGRTTFNVQTADATRPRHIARGYVPVDLLASYWMHLARPTKNPHMRKRERPRKTDSARPANPALIDARYYASEGLTGARR